MLHCPRSILRTTVYSGIFLATGLAPAFALDPTGDWRVADGVAHIRVPECNGGMWGAGAGEKTPGGRDTPNPHGLTHDRTAVGVAILIDNERNACVDHRE